MDVKQIITCPECYKRVIYWRWVCISVWVQNRWLRPPWSDLSLRFERQIGIPLVKGEGVSLGERRRLLLWCDPGIEQLLRASAGGQRELGGLELQKEVCCAAAISAQGKRRDRWGCLERSPGRHPVTGSFVSSVKHDGLYSEYQREARSQEKREMTWSDQDFKISSSYTGRSIWKRYWSIR